jgi:transposase
VARARDDYRALYQQMLERCRKLERGILGPKSERLPSSESQLSLEVLASVLGAEPSAAASDPVTRSKRSVRISA